MSLPATVLSKERVEFLLDTPWPSALEEVDGWLRSAPKGQFGASPADSQVTPVSVDAHEGKVAAFSWFANYPNPASLVEAHDDLAGFISVLLGGSALQEWGRGRDHSGYWVTTRFTIETYAHDVSAHEDGRLLMPTLQVHVADAALAMSMEATARSGV